MQQATKIPINDPTTAPATLGSEGAEGLGLRGVILLSGQFLDKILNHNVLHNDVVLLNPTEQRQIVLIDDSPRQMAPPEPGTPSLHVLVELPQYIFKIADLQVEEHGEPQSPPP